MKRLLKFTLIVLTMLSFNACNKDTFSDINLEKSAYYTSEIFQKQYQEIYGKWKIESITGGIAGSGYEPNFDYLIIERVGIYKFVKNDIVTEYGKILIKEQTSETLEIALVSHDIIDIMPSSDFVLSYQTVNLGDNKLWLIDPCCDLFVYEYSKEN